MKKTLLFFTVFLLFGFLAAEDVKTGEYDFGDITVTLFEEREPEKEPEPEPEPEPEKEPEPEPKPAEPAPETAETTDSSDVKSKELFYFQPLLEGRVGIFNEIGLGFDTGFLVASTEVSDIYTGFSARAVTNVGDAMVSLLFLPKLDFNFKLKDKYLDWIAFWFGLGAEFYFDQSAVYTSEDKVHWIPDVNFSVSFSPAWGIGVDLIFKNYIVLKLGVSTFALLYPELMLGLGYRF